MGALDPARPRGAGRAGLLLCAAALVAAGCGITRTAGRPIAAEQVRTIVPGTTTKSEALDRFGPPLAVAAPGEVLPVPSDPPADVPALQSGAATWSLATGTFFELFPPERKADDGRRIYYFRRFEQRTRNYFLLVGLFGSGTTTTDRLWLLVDERSRLVEDYAFKASGAPVVFGVPRAGAAPRPSPAPDRR